MSPFLVYFSLFVCLRHQAASISELYLPLLPCSGISLPDTVSCNLAGAFLVLQVVLVLLTVQKPQLFSPLLYAVLFTSPFPKSSNSQVRKFLRHANGFVTRKGSFSHITLLSLSPQCLSASFFLESCLLVQCLLPCSHT